MAETLKVLIDLNQAGLDLDPEALEEYSLGLAEELQDGLAEEARLARAEDMPEGSKSGTAAFLLGILTAEVNPKNIKALVDWLGQRIYGGTLVITYGEVKLEYRNSQQLEDQIKALERISELQIRVVKGKSGKG